MRNLFLSLIAIILIAKEQNARQKMYNYQIKITDFYHKHKDKEYDFHELVKGQVFFFKDKH